MQANEFEKKIKSKLESFELAPGENVWENVAASLGHRKRRKRFVFFWLAFLAAGLLAGGWWYVAEVQPKQEQDRSTISGGRPADRGQDTNNIAGRPAGIVPVLIGSPKQYN